MYKMDVNLTKKLMKSQCSLLIYIHVVVSYKLTTFKVKRVKIYNAYHYFGPKLLNRLP